MFKQAYATIAVSDFERAKRFYEEKLGLTPSEELGFGARYQVGSTSFLLYESSFAGTAQSTAASFAVDNLDETMAQLRARGVVFEEYDFPGLKTVNGVADMEGIRSAWFKDSEGNILALGEEPA